MIIKDWNQVPIYMDFKAVICIRLQGVQTPDEPIELTPEERVAKTLYQIDFHLMLGIVNSIVLTHQQYSQLWRDLENGKFD